MSWFTRSKAPKSSIEDSEKLQVPDGLWEKCPSCSSIVYNRETVRNFMLCTVCSYHFRIGPATRIEYLADRGSFKELNSDISTTDPLNFKDSVKYKERLKKAVKKSDYNEAVVTGLCNIDGVKTALGVFNFFFMGGSMGSVVGEKLVLLIEKAIEEKIPVVIVSASGGARMQEGIYSLMQMARVSAALSMLAKHRLPYVSVLTDPTTGGVAASFAMQGDVIIAEPGALIGFAGPRVIEQTIKKKLPKGFQRSEFLLEHGMVDMISPRQNLKTDLSMILKMLLNDFQKTNENKNGKK